MTLNFESTQDYATYKAVVIEKIRLSLKSKQNQPVLFVGSGLSRRYLGIPDWHGLLSEVSKLNPRLRDYNYYRQSGRSQEDIGQVFANEFYEWGWEEGRSHFSEEMFSSSSGTKSSFFKFAVAEKVSSYTYNFDSISEIYKKEILSLISIRPNVIITTNYDNLLESIFEKFSIVVGEDALTAQPFFVGKIYKIHGTVDQPDTIVITSDDYNEFITYKKYLSAKLLAYFIENPILFVGYSIDDRNIKLILQDIDMILRRNQVGLDNIFF